MASKREELPERREEPSLVDQSMSAWFGGFPASRSPRQYRVVPPTATSNPPAEARNIASPTTSTLQRSSETRYSGKSYPPESESPPCPGFSRASRPLHSRITSLSSR